MRSESESLVVGFFHAMRAEAKRARRRPLPTQTAPPLKVPISHEWWAGDERQQRIRHEDQQKSTALWARYSARVDREAELDAWERQFG